MHYLFLSSYITGSRFIFVVYVVTEISEVLKGVHPLSTDRHFSNFFQSNLNNTTVTSTSPEQLKYVDVKPVFKIDSRMTRKTID